MKKLTIILKIVLIIIFVGCTSNQIDGIDYEGKYVGEKNENGERHGQGTLNFANGRLYVGEWKNGVPDGQGKSTWPNGNSYEGAYKNGNTNGQGIFFIQAGEKKFIGEFKDSQICEGKWYNKDGEITGENSPCR